MSGSPEKCSKRSSISSFDGNSTASRKFERGAYDLQNLSGVGMARSRTAGVSTRGQCRRSARLVIISPALASGGDGDTTFLPETGLFLIAVDADRSGAAAALGACRAPIKLFPPLYGENSILARHRVMACAALRWLSGRPGVEPVIRAFDNFSLPLLRWFDPEDAHVLRYRACVCCLRYGAGDDPKLAVARLRMKVTNPSAWLRA